MAILRNFKKKQRRLVNFVIMYNVNRCAIYITLNSTISMKSCRKCPKLKHAHYKYTMCYRTFILVLFIFFYLPRHEFGRPALAISFSDERKSEKEIKWQLLQTLFILQNIIKEDIRLCLFEFIYDLVPSRTLCRKECISNEKHEEVQLRDKYLNFYLC